MANKCGICGADINLMQTQKLADGNCICRKNCRSRGFKVYDYVHGNLSGVKAHLDQVERGTKLWDHYFVPRLKTKDKNQKLTRFGAHLYVAEDIGLVAFTQVDYKILIFGKTTRACVYRIADLRNYKYEEQMVRNGDKTEKKSTVRMVFINTAGMNAFNLEVNNFKEYENAERRIERAKEYLRSSSLPISKIAMEVGYGNFSYFSKTFRELVGCTPNEYRSRQK